MSTDRRTMASLLALSLVLVACQSPRDRARRELASELRTRRADADRSMKLYRRGLAAHAGGDLESARRDLDDAVAADDQNAFAWMALGAVRFEGDALFEAASCFERAARLAPTRYEPHFNIGSVLESAGRYDQAIDAYETALRLAPGEVAVMENLARACIRSNSRLDRARLLMAEALQKEDRPAWTRWMREQLLRLEAGAPDPPP